MAIELIAQWPLALMWVIYGGVHSLLAMPLGKRAIAARLPSGIAARYRLAYNVFAAVALLPIAAWHLLYPGPLLWAWQGAAAWAANGLALLALLGFRSTLRHYDLGAFLGVATAGPERRGLRLSPLHHHVRHPWYSLGLVLIWTRDMNAAMLTSAACISAYLWLGSRREEAGLVEEFGEAYRRYRQRVPGLLPVPWRSLDRAEAEQLEALSRGPLGVIRKE